MFHRVTAAGKLKNIDGIETATPDDSEQRRESQCDSADLSLPTSEILVHNSAQGIRDDLSLICQANGGEARVTKSKAAIDFGIGTDEGRCSSGLIGAHGEQAVHRLDELFELDGLQNVLVKTGISRPFDIALGSPACHRNNDRWLR